ncbi:MAG: hypothetical protein HeimC2_35320 [Candidatus Heimdallarchaeota archaeon LC_2]|nr:MAG: hypothetical protein HeimC2_35320 [Candidatus Heimdallarchaeota archaeon LC_2]
MGGELISHQHLTGARGWLKADNMEINGFEPAFKEDLIVLYETSTGSVGYLKQISNELNQVAKYTLKVLEECECVQSCYNCLRHYRNQSEHPLLNKIDVIPILQELAQSDATLIDTSSQSGPKGIKSPDKDPCGKTESPIEKKLCEEIAKSRLKFPKLQWVLQGSDGVPICRPDFTWKSHKLAVFCDGDEFHSPQKAPEQYQKDIEIQNKLMTMGWQVLRFTGKQINSDVSNCVELIQSIIGK